MTTPEAIRDLVKRARQIERHGVAGPDWRSGQRFYLGGYEPTVIALMPQLADAMEHAIEALSDAERVIGPWASKLTEIEDDGDRPPVGAGDTWVEINASIDDLRAASEWQRKHGTGR